MIHVHVVPARNTRNAVALNIYFRKGRLWNRPLPYMLNFLCMEYSIFWCRLNKYYLNQRLDYFRSHDFADKPYLITTCEVTDRAKQKRVKLAKKKLSEWFHVYITGCWSLKRGKTIHEKQFYGIYPDLLPFSNSITLLWEHPEHSSAFDASKTKENIYTKKYIVIQNGCDNYCSFCLTVHKRWTHQTRKIEEILEEIKKFEEDWGREVVLTWVNIAARWCSDSTKPNESQFAFLLKDILDKTAVQRIRLSSLWPEYLDDDFFTVIENPRIMPHFHLSIQSFSDGVLQRMRRNYNSEMLGNVLVKIRSLKREVPVSIGADIIVGFPGETEKEFQETVAWVKKYMVNKIHLFPFSDHRTWEKIMASSLPDQVDAVTKKRREKELKKIADELAEKFHQLNMWIMHNVLVEWRWSGWTENYLKVFVDPKCKKWEIIQAMVS